MNNRNLKIGDRVRLTEDITDMYMLFPKGHRFTIFDSSYRGWDLVDDNGHKMTECLFIHDKLELCLKEERKEKLEKIQKL